jgi:hypothetical protein
MGLFGQKAPGMGYYTNQTAPREPLGIGGQVDPQMTSYADRPKSPGLFGGGNVYGILGDVLARLGGQQGVYLPQLLQQKQQDREDERWQKKLTLQAQLKAQQPVPPSVAAKMAVEAGHVPGTPAFKNFVSRYAFSPKLVTVGNAQGGEDTIDASGAPVIGGLPAGYDPNEWEVVQ